MPAFMEMHPRVPMRRGVTAPDVPAGQAQTQVHPPRANSQAILAAFRTRRYSANHFQMRVNHLVPIPSGPTLGRQSGAMIGRHLAPIWSADDDRQLADSLHVAAIDPDRVEQSGRCYQALARRPRLGETDHEEMRRQRPALSR
jgi:hypothetical protein